jgi:release factor glutamine methyltransferase
MLLMMQALPDLEDTEYGFPLAGGRRSESVASARRCLAQQFRVAGLDTPDLDARVLVGHALGLDHARLAAQADRQLTETETDVIAALALRRLNREPVARILGTKEFWSLPFALNADTLVPRPESETVVATALDAIDRGHARHCPLRIADLGTGSGALLLALLSELPQAYGVGTELSLTAVACARHNAGALGLAARASFVLCDQAAALKPPFDLVVANPPYIVHEAIATLAPEVRRFDPPLALDGGQDGLDAYRAIARDATRLLAPFGALVVELGIGQHEPVTTLFAAAGLAVEAPRNDLLGVPRALLARRAAG